MGTSRRSVGGPCHGTLLVRLGRRDLTQTGGQRHEGAGQVSAVDGRDVARCERRERGRVVPVEQVPLVVLDRFDRVECTPDPRRQFRRAAIAEVVCGERREQPHADVGRRGAARDPHAGIELHVVRRPRMLGRGHVALEIAPRLAGDHPQLSGVMKAEFAPPRNRRPAQPPCDPRRRQPDECERQRHRSRLARERCEHEQQECRRRGPRPHLEREHARTLQRDQSGGARRGGGCGLPLQQPSLRDDHANHGEDDGVQHLVGVVGQQHDLQHDPCTCRLEFGTDVDQEHAPRLHGPWPTHEVHERQQQRVADHREGRECPRCRGSRQPRPARDEHGQDRGRDEASSKVVDDLESTDHRQVIDLQPLQRRDHRQQLHEDLPIPADPAMLTSGVGQHARREVIHELHVGHERTTRVEPLEQVVRQHRVLADPAIEGSHERIHVVEPLAHECAFAEQVLIGVGGGRAVGVDAGVPAVGAREQRSRSARHGHADARLQDAVALDHAAERDVVARAMQRVLDHTHQLAGGVPRQTGVAIEHDAVLDLRQHAGVTDARREARIGGPPEQSIELLDLAPLALPRHPHAFARVPPAHPVVEVEAVLGLGRIAFVQRLDAGDRGGDHRSVARQRLGRGIGKIGEQCEVEAWIHVGERLHLEMVDQMPGVLD